MNEKEVVRVLQHYRHDLMNKMQIIQGYLSMGKVEIVETKVTDFLEYFNEERKLLSLNAPKFILWVIQFNNKYENFRLTYKIHTGNKKLQAIDNLLVEQFNMILVCLTKICDKTRLFELNLQISETEKPSLLRISLFIDGNSDDIDGFKQNLENMRLNYMVDVKETSNGMMCEFSVPCNI
ncbi:Spo0B domain-containing protein [Virgibacillus sp. C22-A2]|uniref:Spo0B domain-containing protein n=1 Tax=Virgibacillus tibetensis TaxID=3042313 RepID=A0ABU6KAH8_9BACI|nr:Spo0B domain-containing protein [Virgibacillus sp. C22-A2]